MQFHVYALYSPRLDLIYIGQSSKLHERVPEHNKGYSKFTSRTNDWILVYSEQCPNRKIAMKREKQLKSYRGRQFIRSIISNKF
jgi:putative endonuclease